jgi:hypothetical protein
MLIVWRKDDPFFTVEGAENYLKDLPKAQLHLLDTGHFALEEELNLIADKMKHFLDIQVVGEGCTSAHNNRAKYRVDVDAATGAVLGTEEAH